MKSPLERACDGFLITLACLAYGSFLYAHLAVGLFRLENHALALALAFALISLPFLEHPLRRLLKRLRAPASVVRAAPGIELVPILFLVVDPAGPFLIGSLTTMVGHLLVRRDEDNHAGWLIGLAPVVALVGLTVVPARAWLLLVPSTVLVSACALVLVQLRRSRRARASAGELSFMPAREPTNRADSWRLAAYAVPFALITLVCIPVCYLALVNVPVPLTEARRAAANGAARTDAGRLQSAGDAIARSAFDGVFPTNLNYTGGVSRLQHAEVMVVRAPEGVSNADLRRGAPYYLRGLVQDTFTRAGAHFERGADLESLRDRDGDGWTQLGPEPPNGWFELEVEQHPLLTRNGQWSILFSPQPVHAIRLPRVEFHPDGVLIDPEPRPGLARYAVRAGHDDARRHELADRLARHPDPAYTQLPSGTSEVPNLSRLARELTRGARTDAERVQSVVRYFHEHFAYSLHSTDTPGLAGVAEFLKRRKGHCTYFAASSALLLRTLDVPSRVATGFLVQEWSREEEAFVVTTRNGHAWLEVYFEGVGWVRYEPTPSERRRRALAAADAAENTGLGTWFADVSSDVSMWASSGGGEMDLHLLAQTLSDGPRALLHSLRTSPYGVLGALAAGAALWFLLARRAKRVAEDRRLGPRARKPTEFEGLYRDLLRALARRGHRRRATQTPAEFAHAVAASDESLAPLTEITAVLYRMRYASRSAPATRAENAAVVALTSAVSDARPRSTRSRSTRPA